MSDLAEDWTPDTLGAAQLALSVAVDQLTQPGLEKLDRDDPRESPAARDVADEDDTHMATLRGQHAIALRANHHAQARRYLQRIITLQHRINARRADRADLPSLLEQLRDAIESSSSTGGAASAGAHRSPIGLAAAELLGHIEMTIRWGMTASGGHDPSPDIAVQLKAWAARSPYWRVSHPSYLLRAAQQAEAWVVAARALLNPRRTLEAKAPCPVCGNRHAWLRDDTGETVRRAAIQIDYASGSAQCIVPGCTGYWGPERLSLLAAVLEQEG